MDKYICPNHKECRELECRHRIPHEPEFDCGGICASTDKACIRIKKSEIMYIHKKVGQTVIHFKSKPFHFLKEREGFKTNIVRIVSDAEDDQIKQSNIDHIMIEDCMADRKFLRELTDITRFQHRDIIIYIFSWN